MKNWGWIVLLVLIVCILWWSKFGFRAGGSVASCLYSDVEKKIEAICVHKLKDNSLIKSPLGLAGRARGNWFFEASFPIELLDQDGAVLAQTIGTASGDWMTNDLVPFTAELKFEIPLGDTGKLVFKKDNPSGLPQNDASLSIPIRFR